MQTLGLHIYMLKKKDLDGARHMNFRKCFVDQFLSYAVVFLDNTLLLYLFPSLAIG